MTEFYDNPLIARYASDEMSRLWSPRRKFTTWRRLWVALAEAEAELGLPISAAQIAELKAHVDDVDFAGAEAHERRLRHDVMSHVHAYGDVCPAARPIIHLGATSCYVTDNTDLLLMREGLKLIADRLATVIDRLATFATETRNLACLGFTHFQPAQPTTVGKRACLWIYDLVQDLEEVEFRIAGLKARGVKGTTGTQASFLELFGGDHDKVRKLDELVSRKMGFDAAYPVTGQTYSRKVDSQILSTLSGLAQSASKAATDLRLLQHMKEVEEPFEKEQIGSSAMAYKPASTQWLERTLDDSANRRLTLPQSFLATESILILYQNIASGLVVYPQVIARHLRDELPFMATENVLMAAVAKGGDRQTLHEKIRQHSQAAALVVKQQGGENDLLDRMRRDPAFGAVDFAEAMKPEKFVGRAPQQVDDFMADFIGPIRTRYAEALKRRSETALKV
jgi:adenylosuccinate lyase